MKSTPTPVSLNILGGAGTSLEDLDEYLSSDRSPPNCMMVSDLDGFLAGIAIGPELVMPSEWLPAVWGGEGPVFSDDEETKAVLGAILGRYNDILNHIQHGTYQPILWGRPDGGHIAADWAEGFLDAIRLRARAWEPLFAAAPQSRAVLAILAFCGEERETSALHADPELAAEMRAAAPEILARCVTEIDVFWRLRRSGGASGAGTRTAKPGRNEPCPCGSGKKFKKCCGR